MTSPDYDARDFSAALADKGIYPRHKPVRCQRCRARFGSGEGWVIIQGANALQWDHECSHEARASM